MISTRQKYNFMLIFLCSCFMQICAFDEVAYQRLIQGEGNLVGADLQDVKI